MFKADAESRAARRYLKLQVVLQSIEGQKKALRFICAQVERAATASSLAKRISLTPFLGTLGTDGSCRSPSVICALRRPLPDAPGLAPIPASPSGCRASFSACSRSAHARPSSVRFAARAMFVLPIPFSCPVRYPLATGRAGGGGNPGWAGASGGRAGGPRLNYSMGCVPDPDLSLFVRAARAEARICVSCACARILTTFLAVCLCRAGSRGGRRAQPALRTLIDDRNIAIVATTCHRRRAAVDVLTCHCPASAAGALC
jgi:hypothetical protein